MSPPFVYRAVVFGVVVSAIVLGADWFAADVFHWAWFQDPTRVAGAWPPPHLSVHKAVLAFAAAGSLAGMYFSKEAPLPWALLLLAATLFALVTFVGAPIAYLWEGVLGVVGWLLLGSVLAIVWTHAER